jgi:hypothetical protein
MIAPILLLAMLAACQGTRDAYSAAAGDPETTAKVVSEHYIAIIHELNTMKASGQLAGAQLAQAQQLVSAAKPVIDQLAIASSNFQALKNAKTEAELNGALNNATIAVSNLIDLLRGIRPAA